MRSSDTLADLVENIRRLRRAERLAEPELRAEIAPVRAFLEARVGPTISRAAAARLLRISQPALSRWLATGDIPSVLTMKDRREIPLSEVISLLDDIERARNDKVARPVSRVIHDRARRAADAINLDRLLPETKPRTHRVAELQSLAYHRLVAERLDPSIVENARARLRRWCDDGKIHPQWADEWERILELPLDGIRAAIVTDSVPAGELRQSSPFTGVLTEQERLLLHQAVEARLRV
jgi:hypothetical protein